MNTCQGHFFSMTTALSLKIKHSLEVLTEMHGISEAELCRKLDISQSTLNRLITGAKHDPRASTLTEIAQFFNISMDQLLGNKPITQSSSPTAFDTLPSIPLLEWENCMERPKITPSTWKNWIVADAAKNPESCFAIKVEGESMWPKFIEGTTLIVDTSQPPKHRDFVIAYVHKEKEITFKQYIEEKSTRLLKPVNPAFASRVLTDKDKIIGTVIQARNNLTD